MKQPYILLGTPHSLNLASSSYTLKNMVLLLLIDLDQHWYPNGEETSEDLVQACIRILPIPSKPGSLCLEAWMEMLEDNSIEKVCKMNEAGGEHKIVTWCPTEGRLVPFALHGETATSNERHYTVHISPPCSMPTFETTPRAVFLGALREAFRLNTKGMYTGKPQYGLQSHSNLRMPRNVSPSNQPSKPDNGKGSLSWYHGTCEWILKRPEYVAWRASSPSLLWLSGKPGSGKSTLLSFISNSLEPELKQAVYYSYNNYVGTRDPNTELLRMIIKGISRQPLSASADNRLHQIWAALNSDKILPRHAIRRVLMSMLGLIPANAPTLIIIDALDECSWLENEIVSGILEVSTITQNPPPIRCIISSRNNFPEKTPLAFVWKIDLHEELAVQKDMALYINNQSTQLSERFTSYSERSRFFACLLASKPGASFLWVRLIVESLNEEILAQLVNGPAAGGSLPPSLEDIYCQCLESIPSQNKNLASRILHWVAYARRPLTLQELSMALTIGLTHPSAVQSATLSSGDEKQVLDSSSVGLFGGLLTIGRDQTVHLVHQSVKDYLLSSAAKTDLRWYHVDYFQAHELLALTCLRYLICVEQLQSSSFEPQKSADRNNSLSGESVIRDYARENWDTHYRVAETKSQYLVGMLQDYLHSKIVNCHSELGLGRKFISNSHDLHNTIFGICAYYGFETLLKIYLEMGTDLNAKSQPCGPRPLHLAVANNRLSATEILLNAGASVDDFIDIEGRTALHVASFDGYDEVVRLLLEHGAQPNAVTSTSRSTPLHLAALAGNADIVKNLLESGADSNIAMNLTWETPLQYGTRSDDVSKVVSLLRANQLKPEDNTFGQNHYKRLHPESHRGELWWLPYGHQENGRVAYMCEICENEAKVTNVPRSRYNSCRPAKTYQNTDIPAESLSGLDGPEEESNLLRNSCNNTINLFAAHAAALFGIKGFGASKSQTPGSTESEIRGDGWTALHFAAAYGHDTVAKYLICKGANVDAETTSGKTPLALAVEHGHSPVLLSLLTKPGNLCVRQRSTFKLTSEHPTNQTRHSDTVTKSRSPISRDRDQIYLDRNTELLKALALEDSWEFLPDAEDIDFEGTRRAYGR